MARIYIRAEVEVHVDVPDKEVAEWACGEDEDCPEEIRERMEEILSLVVPQRTYVDLEFGGQGVDAWAEVLDVEEVRCES